jgi:hypothetical protein
MINDYHRQTAQGNYNELPLKDCKKQEKERQQPGRKKEKTTH